MSIPLPRAPGAVLMYHRVATLSPDVHRLCISPQVFRQHMQEVRAHCRPMDLTALALGDVSEGATRCVAVTFDDGCLDNLTIASDILREFDIPATFFIGTERLDEQHEFWWDVLERVFISDKTLPSRFDVFEDGVEVYRLTATRDRADAHRVLSDRLRTLAPDARDALMTRICTWSGIDLTPRDTHRPMLAAEVLALSQRPGHAIGAHGVHHLSLPTLPASVQRREVLDSGAVLQSLTGRPVTAFAYPYGHHDETTMAIARTRFVVAVTASAGATQTAFDPMAVPRLDASQLTPRDLATALDGIFRVG